MGGFRQSIKKVIYGSMKGFKDFPVTIGCGLGFTLLAMVKIQLSWEQKKHITCYLNPLSGHLP